MDYAECRIDFKRLRLAKGATQEQVSAALGVRQNTISAWDRGATPHARYLPAIARYFGVTIEELYGLPRP